MRKMSEAALKILKERYFLKDDKGNTIENWEELCRRVAGYIASVEEDEKLWEIEFFEALHNRMFLPNTPTLMNAGKANMGSLHACISGDTLVVTESGLKRMDNIHIGDNVLTHKGRFRRVNNIYNNGLKETIGIFRGDNKKRKSANIFLTEDHKILDENSNWVQAKDVVNPMYPFVSDYTPVKEYDLSTHTNRGLVDGKKIKPIARKHSVGIPKIIKNDLDLAWLLGFYIAEGNISKNEILRFTIHKKEKKFQDKIYKVIYEKTGLHCNTQYSNHGNWMTITCGSVILCDFMKNLIGHGFSSKKIPWTVFAENSEYKKEFLQGINDGDGCSINNGETKLVLANQTVIYQCVLLSRSIGKYVTYKANYSSKLQKTPTSLVSTIKLPTIGSTKINGTLQTVYDIEVEEDHSFVAGDLICHNCFVYPITDSMGTMDSMDSISDSWKAAALIGKEGGGIGYAFSDLRPKGDFISTSKGTSSGPISFMKVNDAVAEAVKQGGTRRIAQMGILNVHHPDILEFIKCKNQEGQIKNFNISVAITDKFMEAVRKNKDYELINPATKKVVSKIPAKDIWDEIVNGAWINGEPGVVFIDTINKHHNLKKVGEIKATNPCCVTGETNVLTKSGYREIKNIIDTKQIIWNGFEWSEVTPTITAQDQEIYDIEFSNGSRLSCTSYHKFYLNNKKCVTAENLKINDKLIKWNFPIINSGKNIEKSLAYTKGFYCGDGSFSTEKKQSSIWLYGEKKKLLNKLKYKKNTECNNDRYFVLLNEEHDKEFVPGLDWSIKSRLDWLAGIIDSDGCKNSAEGGISISSINNKFLNNIKNLLNTLGCDAPITTMHIPSLRKLPDGKGGNKLYNCQETYRITISSFYVSKLKQLGLQTNRVKLIASSMRNTSHYISVISIIKRKNKEKNVYCFNEPLRHMGCFNGIVTGQSEQPLLPLEACVLGSVDVGKLVENKKFNWEELDKIVAVGTRFLDNTVTLSKAPIKEINETVANNRKIGLGIMGFADCLIQLGITYGSDESFAFAEQLAKRIKETAHKTSVDLGKEKGLPLNSKNYENTTPGTPDLKGIPRNACQISYAPTGTIASIADASFGIEPLYDVCFIKNILDGKRIFFVSDIVAKHLKDLGYEKAVKEIESGKSLEEIDIPKKIKDLFATALTLKPEQHVNMQAAFQKYCDSAISKTCNLPNKATKEDVSDIYFMAYDLGCKGITVYRDGSRQLQVIEIGKGKKESNIVTRPDVVHGVTYKIPTSFGKLYMTVNREEETPIEVFFSMADISNDMSSLLSALGRTLSVSLKHGTPLKDIIKTLKKIKVGTVVYYNGKMFKSVPQLIAGVLEEVFAGKPAVATLVSLCDKCGSQLILQEGCEKCSNSECGYTKCG